MCPNCLHVLCKECIRTTLDAAPSFVCSRCLTINARVDWVAALIVINETVRTELLSKEGN